MSNDRLTQAFRDVWATLSPSNDPWGDDLSPKAILDALTDRLAKEESWGGTELEKRILCRLRLSGPLSVEAIESTYAVLSGSFLASNSDKIVDRRYAALAAEVRAAVWSLLKAGHVRQDKGGADHAVEVAPEV